MTGLFLVLEGPDGVGKTTLGQRLADTTYDDCVTRSGVRLRSAADTAPLVFVSRRQVSATSEYSAELMRQVANCLWHSGDSPDLPDAFWVSMQAAWHAAHTTTVLVPLLDAGYDVIVDGWMYKFLSKLLNQGYSRSELDTIFSRTLRPDAVVLLTTDLGDLFDRKASSLRPAEMGMHAGYSTLGKDTFIEYQESGLRRLVEYGRCLEWDFVHLDATATVDSCLEVIRPVVARIRGRSRNSGGCPCGVGIPLRSQSADR